MNRRWRNRLLICFATIALVAFVGHLSSQRSARKRLEQARASLLAKGESLVIADLFVTNAPNGIQQLMDAGARLPAQPHTRSSAGILILDAMKTLSPGQGLVLSLQTNWPGRILDSRDYNNRWTEDMWPEFSRVMEPARNDLNEALSAGTNEVVMLIAPYAENRMETFLPHLRILNTVFDYAGAATLLDLHEGRYESAAQTLASAVRLLAKTAPEPTLVSQGTRGREAQKLLRITWEFLQHTNVPEPQLEAVQNAWLQVEFANCITNSTRMERALGFAEFEQCQADYGHFRNISWADGKPGRLLPTIARLMQGTMNRQDLTNSFAAAVWATRDCYRDGTYFLLSMQTNIEAVVTVINRRSFHPVPASLDTYAPNHLLISRRFWFSSRLLASGIEAECNRSLVVAAVALERYRRHTGTYPPSLTELIPNYLRELPTDWYNGQPIRYLFANGESYQLWSVGNDGIDNKGTPPPNSSIKLAAPDLVWLQPAGPAEVERQRINYRKGKNFNAPPDPSSFDFGLNEEDMME